MPTDLISKMRHRITIQSEILTSDGGGGVILSWFDSATIWAGIDTLPGNFNRSLSSERQRSGQLEDRGQFRFITRYINNITPKNRIIFLGRIFNIRSVINIEEKNEFLHIYAEEGVVA